MQPQPTPPFYMSIGGAFDLISFVLYFNTMVCKLPLSKCVLFLVFSINDKKSFFTKISFISKPSEVAREKRI